MRGEVQSEGAFDEGNARVSGSGSSTLTKMVTFQYMVILTSVFGNCRENILFSVYGPYCEEYSTFSKWLLLVLGVMRYC